MHKPIPVIAIFDVGKTNKKLFLFDQDYTIVFERSAKFEEVVDEDGFPCEDLHSLRATVHSFLQEITDKQEFEVKAFNFSTYGASFVYLDEHGKELAPLYNYLKPYPEALQKQFYDTYGGEEQLSFTTASPVLGSLNSGMQLYRIKYERPDLFRQIRHALHLPQYLSFLLTGTFYTDITSIGCHTLLWDFQKNDYHRWVREEGIVDKLPPIVPTDCVLPVNLMGKHFEVGLGLHDSSAALIPYMESFQEPFVLISTGTWCISLNPFNQHPLTREELASDCLSYLNYRGKAVKASRLFAGYEHEKQVNRLASHFNHDAARYKHIPYDAKLLAAVQKKCEFPWKAETVAVGAQPDLSQFEKRDLSIFSSGDEAYHQLMLDLVIAQVISTRLVIQDSPVKRIFLDGGFSKNALYMNLLASFFPEMEVFAASMAQATAAGTALAIHGCWNEKPKPTDIIKLKYYKATQKVVA